MIFDFHAEFCRLTRRLSRLLAYPAILMAVWSLIVFVPASPPVIASPLPGNDKLPANNELPVREGLLLWLDAANAMAAPTSSDPSKLKDGAPLAVWKDRSGAGRDFEQAADNFRPKLIKVGDAWVVRFDGDDDHLRFLGAQKDIQNASIFVVAAPHENPGEFRGLVAANAAERRDYESGFTIDLGPGPSFDFDQLNAEGKGFGGANDLLDSASPFGTLHVLQVNIGNGQVQLKIDNKDAGSRPYSPGLMSLEQLTVGARFYTNGPGAQQVRGPFKGDLVEVLLFERVLSSDEAASVQKFLSDKHAELADQLPKTLNLGAKRGVQLVKAENPPLIQMLMPGFEVDEVPLELTNINNVRYRADGKLVTLGYNGDVHLLSDTNGDGLPDHAELFWKNQGSLRGPIGLLLTPPDYPKGNGVFVPSKGKVSLIVDTNGDDKADEEIIVAQGWNEIRQTVDAIGIAMDKDGNIYFGLGVGDFANAYQIGDDGIARYDRKIDNGSIQKVSADFSKREMICSGIRFPVALAFNERGDLFCTEQEGATWLANGNPLDELLHIQPSRHYGFPPRHPRHNPDVIDEPSTFDYGPQHQSTCGMVFNESVNGGPVFGPSLWKSNAIVCGESRGKIWRTQLVPTPSGYVATSQLIACLQMLTIDSCVSPFGDLIVACHSGPPDWGTGPAGIGKLFRIRMTQPQLPRPVRTWAEGPQEIRIAFDHPLDPLTLKNLQEQTRVEYGLHVRAGDRFENLVPPYAVVRAQMMEPRFELAINSVGVTNDLRTLIINTAPMSANAHYAVSLPYTASQPSNPASQVSSAFAQHPQVDVDFALHGVNAQWVPADSSVSPWEGCLPHLDLAVSEALTEGSAGHDLLWENLSVDGQLKLQTQLNLHHILRPAIQPGAKIDYDWPAEHVSLMFESDRPLTVELSRLATGVTIESLPPANGRHQTVLKVSGDQLGWVPVTVTLATGSGRTPELRTSITTNEDSRQRPLTLHRQLLSWVDETATIESAPKEAQKIAEIEGGSWSRGRRVFRSEAAGCFKCHSVGGGGAKIGPDLMNVVHRDYTSVLRDLQNPGFAINPDYIGHIVELSTGQVLTGVLQTENNELLLGDEKGVLTRIDRAQIETMVPSKTSVMPKGLVDKLTAEQLRDLMTYLLTPPPQMPLESPLPAPPLRTQAQVAAALAGSTELKPPLRPLNLVLVAGPKDHGPGEHDYPAWQRVWEELFMAANDVTVTTAWEFPSDEQLATADVLLFFQKGSWNDDRAKKMDDYFSRGKGAVYIHWAVNGDDQVKGFSERIGLASWGGRIRYRHGPLSLEMHNTDHPILRNFDDIQLYDESYWLLTGYPGDVTLLASSVEDGMATPQLWVKEQGKGRVFVSIPGHFSWTFDDPLFRIILLRGIAWTAHEPVDRFNELVPIGARISR